VQTIESWALDIMLVAELRSDADSYIREQAKEARKTWGKKSDLVTRQSLNLIIKCTKPQQLMNATYHYLSVKS